MTSQAIRGPGAADSADSAATHRRRGIPAGISDQGYARDTLRSYDRAIVHSDVLPSKSAARVAISRPSKYCSAARRPARRRQKEA